MIQWTNKWRGTSLSRKRWHSSRWSTLVSQWNLACTRFIYSTQTVLEKEHKYLIILLAGAHSDGGMDIDESIKNTRLSITMDINMGGDCARLWLARWHGFENLVTSIISEPKIRIMGESCRWLIFIKTTNIFESNQILWSITNWCFETQACERLWNN